MHPSPNLAAPCLRDIAVDIKSTNERWGYHCHSFSFFLSLKSLKSQSDYTFSGANTVTPEAVTVASCTLSVEWQSLS